MVDSQSDTSPSLLYQPLVCCCTVVHILNKTAVLLFAVVQLKSVKEVLTRVGFGKGVGSRCYSKDGQTSNKTEGSLRRHCS